MIDHRHQLFGYENLLVCDGAAIPSNIGVNPSLTITAMAERALSYIPHADTEPVSGLHPSGGVSSSYGPRR